MGREQIAYLYKSFGGRHIRYWVAYNDMTADEKQRLFPVMTGKPDPWRSDATQN